LNWATANWSRFADLVKLNIRAIRGVADLKLIADCVFHLVIYFIQHDTTDQGYLQLSNSKTYVQNLSQYLS